MKISADRDSMRCPRGFMAFFTFSTSLDHFSDQREHEDSDDDARRYRESGTEPASHHF
jgi:hypothetical protein